MSESKIEAPGKTFAFKSPLSGNNVLVKTVIEVKNNLFHCLCLASNDNYLFSSQIEREKIVKDLITKFKEHKWKNLSSNSKKEDIYESSKDLLKDLLKNNSNENESKDKEYRLQETKKIAGSVFTNEKIIKFYKILFDLVNMDRWKKILKMNNNESKKYFDDLVTRKIDSLDDKRKKILKECFDNLLSAVSVEANEMSYQKFLKKDVLNTSSMSLNDNLEAFQSILKCDIFVLNEEGIPITDNKIFKNQNQAIILLNNSYSLQTTKNAPVLQSEKIEVIGKLLAGNKISRKIDGTDMLIKKIKACFDKSILKREYRSVYDTIYKSKSVSSSSKSESSDSEVNASSDSESTKSSDK